MVSLVGLMDCRQVDAFELIESLYAWRLSVSDMLINTSAFP